MTSFSQLKTMQIRTKLWIATIGLTIFCAWKTTQTNDITEAAWLIGTWENKTPKGSIYETWSKLNDHEYIGKSFITKEKDTIVAENIRLVQQ
ncbi:hypothetical protein GCM10023231_16900 [Olivibacter ginsenosidimutans]|uniref:DUF2147 domain-containing protein n=1 Tax=Olivibacter ginsenosidimutans TaxID=1176537 RepID=A0ABP9B1W5_9SPHI